MNILGLKTTRPIFLDRLAAAVANPDISESERELALHADHLDRATAERLDQALLAPSPREKAMAMATALEEGRGKGDPRCLFAAAVEGVRELHKEIDAPVMELTQAAVESGAGHVRGARQEHLEDLTDAACVGLKAYAGNPSADLIRTAASLEDKVGVLLDDIIPTLVRHRPELAQPLEVLRLADLSVERNGSLYSAHSAGDWMRARAGGRPQTFGSRRLRYRA